jgi:hypothetical protein
MRFIATLLFAAGAVTITGCGESAPRSVSAVEISTDGLAEAALSGVPAGAFDSVSVLPLEDLVSDLPLWAVHSSGMLNWDLDPLVSHFLAVYTWADSSWIELDRMILDDDFESPDYIFSEGVAQVDLTEDFLWLSVEGGIGAHGGSFQLVTFDGERLVSRFSGGNSTPGFAHLENLPADSLPDLVLDYSDPYVFFYASGVRKTDIRIMRWDELDLEMVEMQLQRMPQTAPEDLVAQVDRAVDLAGAGLWMQASLVIDELYPAEADLTERDGWIVNWDYVIITQNLGAAEGSPEYGYPLLSYVFYGNYGSAMEIVSQYTADEIFSTETPLIVETVAEGWESELASELITSTEAALEVDPGLAGAWFLRGWGTWLADPESPLAAEYVMKASLLDPDDSLYESSLEILSGQ